MDDNIPPAAYAISDMLRRKKSIPPEMAAELLSAVMRRHDAAFADLQRIGIADHGVLDDLRAAVAPIKAAMFGTSS